MSGGGVVSICPTCGALAEEWKVEQIAFGFGANPDRPALRISWMYEPCGHVTAEEVES